MATKKISALVDAGALDGTEIVPLVKGGVTKRSTANTISLLASGTGSEIILTPGPTPSWNLATSKKAKLTLGEDSQLVITGAVAQDFGQLRLVKGAHTFYFPDNSMIPNGLALVGTNILSFFYDGTNYWWSADVDYQVAPPVVPPPPAQEFLTWNILNASSEVYNTAKGIRRTGAGGDGWGRTSWSDQTIGDGQAVTFKIGSSNTMAKNVSLNPTRTNQADTAPGHTFGLYLLNTSIINTMELGVMGAQAIPYAVGDLVRIRYTAPNIFYEKSVDAGVTWTAIATSPATPTGVYFVAVEPYEQSNLNALEEIYKE